MSICRAKIIVDMPDRTIYSKDFIGTEEQIYQEAIDWSEALALRYIHDRNITDEIDQGLALFETTHTIEWDYSPQVVYGVIQVETFEDNLYGVYENLADAEEAIFTECETWAYEVLMTDDPKDVLGVEEWDYPNHWLDLMADCGRAFAIQPVNYYGG